MPCRMALAGKTAPGSSPAAWLTSRALCRGMLRLPTLTQRYSSVPPLLLASPGVGLSCLCSSGSHYLCLHSQPCVGAGRGKLLPPSHGALGFGVSGG